MAAPLTTHPSGAHVQSFLLARLYRAVALGRQADALEPAKRKFLRAATFSFYCDCVDAGVGERARQAIGATDLVR